MSRSRQTFWIVMAMVQFSPQPVSWMAVWVRVAFVVCFVWAWLKAEQTERRT